MFSQDDVQTTSPHHDASGAVIQAEESPPLVRQHSGGLTPVAEIIRELKSHLSAILEDITCVESMTERDTFQYLSKGARNDLIHRLLRTASSIDDVTRQLVHQRLRRIKRVRPSHEVIDQALGYPHAVRADSDED